MDLAWDEYRRRRRAVRLALLLFPLWLVPGAMIQHFVIDYGYDANGLVTLIIVMLPPMACLVVTHLRLMHWPCPRCGRSFHVSWLYGNPFARRCVNCGLPKWTPKQKAAKKELWEELD